MATNPPNDSKRKWGWEKGRGGQNLKGTSMEWKTKRKRKSLACVFRFIGDHSKQGMFPARSCDVTHRVP